MADIPNFKLTATFEGSLNFGQYIFRMDSLGNYTVTVGDVTRKVPNTGVFQIDSQSSCKRVPKGIALTYPQIFKTHFKK